MRPRPRNDSVPRYVEWPQYVSPQDFSFKDYSDVLKQANRALQRHMAEILSRYVSPQGRGYAIVATGSDGRLEKGPYKTSQLELMLLFDSARYSDGVVRALQTAQRLYNGEIFDLEDVRDIQKDSMSFYQNDPNKPFPTRIMDGRLLLGDKDVMCTAKRKLFAEFEGEPGRKVLHGVNSKMSEFKRVIEREGKQRFQGRDIIQYEIDGEITIAYFDPQKNQQAFKAGPLRFVQYMLMHEEIRCYRAAEPATKNEHVAFFNFLPTTIADRIYYLQAEERLQLTPSEMNDLANAYRFFVWAYNFSQEAFEKSGQTEIEFKTSETKEMFSILLNIAGKRSRTILIK